jgi:fumarate reductase subunit D
VAIIPPILVLVLGLTMLSSNISAGADCQSISFLDTFMQAIAVTLVTYVTYITRRLDKEVYRGGE